MVKFDKQVLRQLILVRHLEGCVIPVDAVKTHETNYWWNIGETSLSRFS